MSIRKKPNGIRVSPAIIASCGLLLSGTPATSRAQSEAAPSQTQPAADPGILAGPQVEEEATTTSRGSMRPNAQRDQARNIVPFARWLRILNAMNLTDEQRSTIDGLVADFEKARAEYNAAHEAELDAIRARQRAAREQGQPANREDVRKLRDIEQGAPKPVDVQQQIWEQLSPDQQDAFRARLERVRAELERGRTGNRNRGDQPGDAMDAPPMMDEDRMAEPRAPAIDRAGRDSMARRRWAFLMAHQSASKPGTDATPEERRFEFDEDDDAGNESGGEPMSDSPRTDDRSR